MVRGLLTFSLLAVAALAAAAPVQAQEGASLPVFFTADLLQESTYIDCQDSHFYGMSLDEPAEGAVYTGASFAVLGCSVQFDFVAPFDQQLQGDVAVHAEFGCSAPALGSPSGTQLKVEMYVAGSLVSTNNLMPGDCMDAFTVDTAMASKDSFLPAGKVLRFEFTTYYLNPYNSAYENLHLAIGPSFVSGTGLGVPFIAPVEETGPAEPQAHFENVTADALSVDHQFSNATSDTYTYNWTTNFTDAEFFLDAQVDAGKATVAVVDANGTSLFTMQTIPLSHPRGEAPNGTMAGNSTAGNTTHERDEPTALFEGAAAGNWTVTITYEDFVGDLDFYAQPQDAPVETVHEDIHSEPPIEQSPGLPLIGLLAALGLVLTLRRA